uniref:Putative ovule protein n=1 Tax=Solanum chacoense TaxID=4108 RepID=A0A0V0IVJ9_SOLCH
MSLYLLSAMNPTKRVMNQLQQLFAGFFWSKSGGDKGKHWIAWEELCYPKLEGGIGMRSLNDVSKALYSKLWWNFRTSTSLWSTYMWNKYCKKQHPMLAMSKGDSYVWKKMVEIIGEEVEHNIWWQIKSGEVSLV